MIVQSDLTNDKKSKECRIRNMKWNKCKLKNEKREEEKEMVNKINNIED